jgi:hypothetical protein
LKYLVSEWKGESGKSATYRIGATTVVLEILQCGREASERQIDNLEWILRQAATDREQKARTVAKQVWELYQTEYEERVDACVILQCVVYNPWLLTLRY